MQKNEILLSYGNDYKGITKRLLAAADLASRIPEGARIGIKPNLVTPSPAPYGATTHPEIIAGILEYLQSLGFSDITILEGSWVGDQTQEAFEYCGYHSLAEAYGVRLLDTQKEASYRADCAGMQLNICRCMQDIDFLINVPVLKGHCQTKMTCALKNLKGIIPNSEKRRFHKMNLHEPIAHLNAAVRQDFIVVDHICGDLDFEEGGNPVERNCIMVSLDPVLTDAYACSLLQYTPEDVPYVRIAERLKVGSADLSRLKLTILEGTPSENALPAHRVLDVSYAVDAVDSCSACYGTLLPALEQLRSEGLLEKLSEKISIGQGFRGKCGALGIGNCTARFTDYIKGCPPSEEDILAFLRAYIPAHDKTN